MTTRSADKAADRLDPALRRLIAILILGAMAPLLDTTIVNVALNTIVVDLSTTVSTAQWIGTGYLLAMGMAIPLAGWATGRLGGKRAWLLSLVLFLASSVLAGIAWDIGSLIAFRVVQGVASGLMLPILQTLVIQAAAGQGIGRLMAAVSLPAVVAPILGPVLGGVIVGNTSWRWIFLINVPICVAGLVAAARGLDTGPRRPGKPLDLLGLGLLSPGLAAVLFAFSQFAVHRGPTAVAVVVLVAGLVALVGFVAHALRTGHEPIIDLRLFRVRSFSASTVLLFLSGLSLFGGTLLVPLYLQQARHLSAVTVGLLLVPQGIGALLARRVVGRITDRVGARPVVLVGILLTVLPTVAFSQVEQSTSPVVIGLCLLVFGAGVSTVSIAVLAAAFTGLDREQVPHASGATRILLQVGGSFGTSVIALVLAAQTSAHPDALDAAFSTTFWWAAGFALVAVLPALLLPRPTPSPSAAAAGPGPSGADRPGEVANADGGGPTGTGS
ncbi:MDR family MFS transporter [Actinokineospora inagensis]|uniref:MDR family MFS transporter n=1 Tax=Actinokineospora inagensis TaxID=103730 RepID=UPI0004075354|nr:MDR family MFS transporter [Actinokineospora inagensis]